VQAQVEIRSDRPIVVTMRPGVVKAIGPARGMMTVTDVPVTLDPSSIRETFVRLERPQVQDIDLSTADIIVSARRPPPRPPRARRIHGGRLRPGPPGDR